MPKVISQFPATFYLGNLNGQNGATFRGINSNDLSGTSVSAAGDVNGDGVDDFLIGAPRYPTGGTSASYLIFGNTGIWNASLSLSSLNGTNGVTFPSINLNDYSGYVGAAGDVNADGIDDFLIGAWGASSRAGATYLLFGKRGTWSTPFSLSALNGANGVRYTGVSANNYAGFSVGGAGDVNGDGIDDFLIGAYGANTNAGASYLLFGHNSTWTTPLSLSSQGIQYTGVNSGDFSGKSVNNVGDVNADGIDDFIIGAYGTNSGIGTSYLLFGTTTGWSTPRSLTNYGIRFTGINTNDYSGYFVSAAGDVNGDGVDDFLIASLGANANAGVTYLVFGRKGTWTNPFNLSALNGINGVAFTGINSGDASGYSVSAAGDVNGDGFYDIIIGAPSVNSGDGASYLIFGRNGTWITPMSLSNLNGYNGLTFRAANLGDGCGSSVSSAGDVNDDGLSDIIIGAPNVNSGAGASYVVFGDASPQLTNNRITIADNQTLIFNSAFLNATDINHPQSSFNYTLTNVTNGYFSSIYNPSIPVFNFTHAQFKANQIQFVHPGNHLTSTYSIGISTPGIAYLAPQSANVTFLRSFPPTFVSNYFSIAQGQTVRLNQTNFNVTDVYFDQNPLNLRLSFSAPQNLRFNSTITNSQITAPFKQSDLQNLGNIVVTHDGTRNIPTVLVSAIDDTGLASTPQLVNINYTPAPQLVNNTLSLKSREIYQLSNSNIASVDFLNPPAANIMYNPTNVQNCFFAQSGNLASAISSFSQQDILNSLIYLVSNNNFKPSYNLLVSNTLTGAIDTSNSPPTVNFHPYPVLRITSPSVASNVATQLSTNFLNVTNQIFDASTYTFYPSLQNNLTFSLNDNPSSLLSNFSLSQLQRGMVQIQNTGLNPSFNITVTDYLGLSDGPKSVMVNYLAPPTLSCNPPSINQGQTLVLSPSNFNASSTRNPSPNNLTFKVSNITHCYFDNNINPNFAIDQFTLEDVQNGQIRFTSTNNYRPTFTAQVIELVENQYQVPSPIVSPLVPYADIPVFVNNQLRGITQSVQTPFKPVSITSSNIAVSDTVFDPNSIVISIDSSDGSLEFESNSTGVFVPVESFAMKNVTNGDIFYKQLGAPTAPIISLKASNGVLNSTSVTDTSGFIVVNPAPRLLNAQLSITQNQQVFLSNINFNANDGTNKLNQNYNMLIYTISNIENGYFSNQLLPGQRVTSFTQADINQGLISFTSSPPIGTKLAPKFMVSLLNQLNGQSISPVLITPSFSPLVIAPTLDLNKLVIKQGGTVVLGPQYLLASSVIDDVKLLQITFSDPVHCQFKSNITGTLSNLRTPFTVAQQNITRGNIRVVHDNTPNIPSYNVMASNGQLATSPQPVSILPSDWTLVPKNPDFLTCQFTVDQGRNILINSNNLYANDEQTPTPQLTFNVENQQFAYFAYANDPNQNKLTYFEQVAISSGNVILIPDGTATAPIFNISVANAAGLKSYPSALNSSNPCTVVFNPALIQPLEVSSQGVDWKTLGIGIGVSGAGSLLFFLLRGKIWQYWIEARLKAAEDKRIFPNEMVYIIMKKLLKSANLEILGCHLPDSKIQKYLGAISTILEKLSTLNVPVEHEQLNGTGIGKISTKVVEHIRKVINKKLTKCNKCHNLCCCKREVENDDMEDKANMIALAIKADLGDTSNLLKKKDASSSDADAKQQREGQVLQIGSRDEELQKLKDDFVRLKETVRLLETKHASDSKASFDLPVAAVSNSNAGSPSVPITFSAGASLLSGAAPKKDTSVNNKIDDIELVEVPPPPPASSQL